MAFGKPKKVGMPKRHKKAVPVPETVPVTEGIGATAGKPPFSPPRKALQPREPPTPPSPGKIKRDTLKLKVKFLKTEVKSFAKIKVQRQAEREVLWRTCAAKQKQIVNAFTRKRRPLQSATAWERLAAQDKICWESKVRMYMERAAEWKLLTELRDAEIALLQCKLQQMGNHVSDRLRKRFGLCGVRKNPMARFKFGPRK